MSNKIYVVTMENDDMNPVEIGYASSRNIAEKMIAKISMTDGFEMNNYEAFQATVNYMEINDETICFEEPHIIATDNNDLIIQFSILWGMTIGSAFRTKEIEIANEMKQWDSLALYKVFLGWKDEYLSQNDIEDSVEFFETKLTDLLYE